MRTAIAALLVIAGAAVVLEVRSQLFGPLPLDQPVTVEAVKGSALDSLLRRWEELGYVGTRQRWYVSLHARLSGRDAAIKAGEYRLEPGMRAVDLTQLLVSGKTVLHELRLTEGWTFDVMLQSVAAHPALTRTLPELNGEAVMQALGQPGLHPEGRFYPDTYRFPRGTTDVEFLRRAYDLMAQTLGREWDGRAAGLPYADPYEALIMASIIERETSLARERAEIAGVFVRRLERRMRLQTDPTVIYGMGDAFDGNLRKRDLLADTPYNTYTRHGLPPTPICLPGGASIHAALHPAPGESLYFVSKGDGSHHFSASLAEHEAAVRKYQLRRSR